MSELTHFHDSPLFEDIRLTADDIRVRQISLSDLWQSLREGYGDFSAKPGIFPFIILYSPLFALLITLLFLGQEMRYLAFPVVAGFTLIGPMIAVCFFELSHLREQGKELRWGDTFRFIHTHSFAPLLALSVCMMLLYVSWLGLAQMLFFGTFGENYQNSTAAFLAEVFTTRHGWALIGYGNLLGFLFAYAAMAISVVSFPLALDKPVTTATAVKVSIIAFIGNFKVLVVWGLIVVLLLVLGTALFFVGLAFILPILGHATWHLYRKLID